MPEGEHHEIRPQRIRMRICRICGDRMEAWYSSELGLTWYKCMAEGCDHEKFPPEEGTEDTYELISNGAGQF